MGNGNGAPPDPTQLQSDLLWAGRLYQVGQTLAATVLAGAQFALWNGTGGLRKIILFWVSVSSAVATTASLYSLSANPALGAGSTPQNLLLSGPACAASYQAAVAALPGVVNDLCDLQTGVGGPADLMLADAIILDGNNGVLVSTAAIAGNVSVAFLWGEL